MIGSMTRIRLIRNTLESVTAPVFSIATVTQNVLALKPEEVRFEETYSSVPDFGLCTESTGGRG